MAPANIHPLPTFVESDIDLGFALDAHSIAIFQSDARTGEISWAPGSAERLGFDDPPTYDQWAAIIDPCDLNSTIESLNKAAKIKAPSFRYCFRMQNDAGTVRVIEGSSRLIYDNNGDLLRTSSVAIDVTGRFEVRQALRASHNQFQSVLETSPTALIITNDRGAILSFSKAAEILFQRSAADVVGQHFNCLTNQKVKALLTAAKRTQGDTHFLSAMRADGILVPVEVSVHEFSSLDGELFTIFVRDMSERLEAEQRQDILRDELAHSARLNTMGEVSAGIAHELNQPLTAMANYLGAARNTLKNEATGPDEADRLIQLASQQALRAGDIIRKMREFLKKGAVDLRPYPVDLLIRESVSLTSLGTSRPQFEIEIDVDDSLPEVMVDRIQVQQVLINLLKNAADALRSTPGKAPKVAICASSDDPCYVTILVKDNGPGLPACLLDHLYEPFTSTKDAGMGLGLSISRRIVEAHGSSLVGKNQQTGGAVFRFNLPIANKGDQS